MAKLSKKVKHPKTLKQALEHGYKLIPEMDEHLRTAHGFDESQLAAYNQNIAKKCPYVKCDDLSNSGMLCCEAKIDSKTYPYYCSGGSCIPSQTPE